MTYVKNGTYDCPVCGEDSPHEHVLALSELIDTDKLLRFLAAEGDRFSLSWVSDGWIAHLFRAGMSAKSREVVIAPFRGDRWLSSGKHGTGHLALRELARLVDEDTRAHTSQEGRKP